jgi:hypothetical protein
LLRLPKNLTFFDGHDRRYLVTCEQQDRIGDSGSSNVSRALLMSFYLL